MLGPVCAQVIRQAEVSASDRKFPALTDGSGTQRARRLRSCTAFDISPPWSSSSPSDLRIYERVLVRCSRVQRQTSSSSVVICVM